MIVVSYDVTNDKQTEFKEWLISNSGWKSSDEGNSLPGSTLMKDIRAAYPGDIAVAKSEFETAASAVGCEISSAIYVSAQNRYEIRPTLGDVVRRLLGR